MKSTLVSENQFRSKEDFTGEFAGIFADLIYYISIYRYVYIRAGDFDKIL